MLGHVVSGVVAVDVEGDCGAETLGGGPTACGARFGQCFYLRLCVVPSPRSAEEDVLSSSCSVVIWWCGHLR